MKTHIACGTSCVKDKQGNVNRLVSMKPNYRWHTARCRCLRRCPSVSVWTGHINM